MIKKYTFILLIFTALISSNLYAQYNGNFNKKLSTANVEELEIKVYPNPVKSGEYITIEFKNFNKEKPISISVINCTSSLKLYPNNNTNR